MTTQTGRARFEAGNVTFIVQHELWDGNIQDHSDQGVVILVDVGGETALRFNCFDIEKSYVYAPDGKNVQYRMDHTVDGNPIGWSVKTIRNNLATMLTSAGYADAASAVDMNAVNAALSEVDSTARAKFAAERNTVKHNRGTDIIEAGNIRFGLEMRRQASGDGGLAIHVLSDLAGNTGRVFTEETELLAFDCFRDEPHYHYGPRNKNHRIFWDKTLVPDPLGWCLDQFKTGKLKAMLERAGYPGVAADLDEDLLASVIPQVESRGREMEAGGIPPEVTPKPGTVTTPRQSRHPGLLLPPPAILPAAVAFSRFAAVKRRVLDSTSRRLHEAPGRRNTPDRRKHGRSNGCRTHHRRVPRAHPRDRHRGRRRAAGRPGRRVGIPRGICGRNGKTPRR